MLGTSVLLLDEALLSDESSFGSPSSLQLLRRHHNKYSFDLQLRTAKGRPVRGAGEGSPFEPTSVEGACGESPAGILTPHALPEGQGLYTNQ